MASTNPGFYSFKYSDFSSKKLLGQGKFGEVYVAKHPMFPKVAVRIVSRSLQSSHEKLKALTDEAKVLFSIVSPYVLRLLGVVLETQHLCLIFEYAEYGSLVKVLKRCALPWSLKIRIAHEISTGMVFLHSRGIFHLSLKCTNVLIAENLRVKISDICMHGPKEMTMWTSLARSNYSRSQANDGVDIAHVPPELIKDINTQPSEANDVYAYGIILWQILTNEIPYENEKVGVICDAVVKNGRPSLAKVPNDRPQVLYDIMTKCWDSRRGNRPSFQQIKNNIEPLAQENSEDARNKALECQAVLNDFNLENNFAAPESDALPHRQSGGRSSADASADGAATRIRLDEVGAKVPPPAARHSASQCGMGLSQDIQANQGLEGEEAAVSIKDFASPFDDEARHIIPAEGSPKIATAEDFYIVASELSRNWRRFGHYLGFSDGDLDTIDANYNANGYPEIPYQMLRRWKERKTTVTLGELAAVLKNNQMSHIAQKLRP